MVQVNFSTREGWLFLVLWIHYIYISYHYILVWVKTTTLQVNESSSPWKIFKTCKLTFTKNTPNSNPLLSFCYLKIYGYIYIYSHFCAASSKKNNHHHLSQPPSLWLTSPPWTNRHLSDLLQLMVDPKSASPDELILVAPLGFNFTTMLGCGFGEISLKDVKGWLLGFVGAREEGCLPRIWLFCFFVQSGICLKVKPKKGGIFLVDPEITLGRKTICESPQEQWKNTRMWWHPTQLYGELFKPLQGDRSVWGKTTKLQNPKKSQPIWRDEM